MQTYDRIGTIYYSEQWIKKITSGPSGPGRPGGPAAPGLPYKVNEKSKYQNTKLHLHHYQNFDDLS